MKYLLSLLIVGISLSSCVSNDSKKRETENLAIAKKYLDVNKMNIVLVGDKKKILPGLQRLGYEIVELDADGNVVK